ncbi:MAG: FAD-binding oxidoreductase [Defluviitaleaceae bacterium]|nr:FAD-binding oxidoreductase [Defluviitaleaceae bacterium]
MEKYIIDRLIKIVGDSYILQDNKKMSYLYDSVNPKISLKANEESIVVKPENEQQIAEIVKLANENNIIIVARGAGTGLSGGATATKKSIVISMERLNKIIEIDRNNMVATVEAGVTLESLYKEMNNHEGIWFPAHPAFDTAQLGGIAATNGGGARAIRHGIMRRHVLGMEIVTPTGEILKLGGKLIKDNAGFNLMHLIIGSEGALAIITKLIIRLYPEDKFNGTIIAAFDSIDKAAQASLAISQSGVVPLALEYLDRHLLTGACSKMNEMTGSEVSWPMTKGDRDLIIIISESSKFGFEEVLKTVEEACKDNGAVEHIVVQDKKTAKELIDARAHYYYYIQPNISHYFDMTVPVASIPNFFKELNALFEHYGTTTNICAHIGDGNLHNDISLDENGNILPFAEELKTKMYELCLKYGGTVTGEHGIGKMRVKELALQKSKTELDIMRGIKKVFDPKGLLNPGVVIAE